VFIDVGIDFVICIVVVIDFGLLFEVSVCEVG